MNYASKIKHATLDSGAQIFASTFPVPGEVSFVGSLATPPLAAGHRRLADMHALMLLEGTRKRDKREIQAFLDTLGASLQFSIARERLCFAGSVSSRDLGKILALVSEALAEPLFSSRELAYLVTRLEGDYALEAQDTRTQAAINLSQMLFGPDHPNYLESTADSLAEVQAITAQKLKAYHTHAIDGASLVLSVSGDIVPRDVFSLAQKHFGRLPRETITRRAPESAKTPSAGRIDTLIQDKSSIDCMFGIRTGITKDHPDYPALLLGMLILGTPSGFTGRLMRRVREEEGLTYGTYAYMSGFGITDGFLSIYGTFAPQLFERGRAALLREMRLIVDDGVTAGEVRSHREQFKARSRVRMSDSGAFAGAAHDVAIEGHPIAYLDEFPKRMLSVTKRQVDAALQKYLLLEKLSESNAGPLA